MKYRYTARCTITSMMKTRRITNMSSNKFIVNKETIFLTDYRNKYLVPEGLINISKKILREAGDGSFVIVTLFFFFSLSFSLKRRRGTVSTSNSQDVSDFITRMIAGDSSDRQRRRNRGYLLPYNRM